MGVLALTKDEAAVKRFEREVKAAAKLTHPNIVQTYDAGAQRGVHYLVMEFVDGRDLSAIVKQNGPLPVQEATDCILQAARGLEFAHKKGVVHRDIKPANIMINRSGRPQIMDFGLAKALGKSLITKEAKTMGTVAYMSPEQAESRSVDARSDIFSFGLVSHACNSSFIAHYLSALLALL